MGLEKSLNLKDGEQVIYLGHRFALIHWPWMALSFILIVGPFFFLFPLFNLGWIGVVIFFCLIAFGIVFALRQLVKWYYTVFVVTPERIIDMDQKGLFDRTVSPVPFQNIQGVAFRMKGLFQTIFKYGTVIIETTQGDVKIEVRKVRHPHVLEQLIDELRLRAQEQQEQPGQQEDEKIKAIKEFTEKLSIDDVKKLVQKLKQEERDEAVSDLYSDQ